MVRVLRGQHDHKVLEGLHRPVKLTVHQRQEALQRLADGAVQADLARSYGVSEAAISRLAAASPFEHGAVGL
jgi:hypothetical protein